MRKTNKIPAAIKEEYFDGKKPNASIVEISPRPAPTLQHLDKGLPIVVGDVLPLLVTVLIEHPHVRQLTRSTVSHCDQHSDLFAWFAAVVNAETDPQIFFWRQPLLLY